MHTCLKLLRIGCGFTAVANNSISKTMSYYAVACGRTTGIFETWKSCEEQVKGYKNPKFQKFKKRAEAEEFLLSHSIPVKPQEKKPTSSSSSDLPPPTDFWPEESDWNADDDDFLLAASAEVEGFAESGISNKRKISPNETSSSSDKRRHKSVISEPIGVRKYGYFEFPIDSDGYVIVYTDGSCENNGQANAVAGFGVYFADDHPLNAAKPVVGRVTNNAGEIQASLYAIQIAKDIGIKQISISTDSQFLINSVTLWMKSWKRKGWKTASGAPVKNVEDFMKMDELLSSSDIKIKWNYVKGHRGIDGNEKADKLAKKGAQMYKEQIKTR